MLERRTQTHHCRSLERESRLFAHDLSKRFRTSIPPLKGKRFEKKRPHFFAHVHCRATPQANILAAFSRYTCLRLASGRPNPLRLQ